MTESKIIPGASYAIYDEHQSYTTTTKPYNLPGGYSRGPQDITYYTCDGKELAKIPLNFTGGPDPRIDPEAPKPLPVSFRRVWWPAFAIGGWGLTKGVPGEFVLFFDKRGVCIDYQRAEDNFDASGLREHPSDFSLKRETKSGGTCLLM